MPVTALSRRTPLRVKLVAAVLVLVTVALFLISVASTLALRAHLTDRIDRQLVETTQRPELRNLPVGLDARVPLLPSYFLLEWLVPGGNVFTHHPQYDRDDLPPLPSNLSEAVPMAGEPFTVSSRNGETRWRVLVTVFPENGTALYVAQDTAEADSAVTRLIWTEVVIGAAVLAVLAALGVVAVRGSLRPLGQIETTAAAIAAGDLTQRVPDPEPDNPAPRTEVGRLARALNVMLTQIERAFADRAASEQRMRRFVADASHELRTPLTTIRGFAELYRQGGAGSPEQAGRLVRRIEDEASRMGLLVEDLLLLARLDQQRPLASEPVELPVVVTEAVHGARAVAPDRTVELEVETDGAPLVVRGDEARLRQVVDNLLNNALTHTPADTPVTVRLRAEPGTGVIEVSDRGPGLTGEQAARVFERFYRVDAARSRPGGPAPTGGGPAGGSGLGLAIVAALVNAHQGTVEVDSEPGAGATFRVRLPLRSADGQAGPSAVQD